MLCGLCGGRQDGHQRWTSPVPRLECLALETSHTSKEGLVHPRSRECRWLRAGTHAIQEVHSQQGTTPFHEYQRRFLKKRRFYLEDPLPRTFFLRPGG